MSRPVNTWCPCDGDAFLGVASRDSQSCERCDQARWSDGKCLADEGWAFMALAATEVARERAPKPRTASTY